LINWWLVCFCLYELSCNELESCVDFCIPDNMDIFSNLSPCSSIYLCAWPTFPPFSAIEERSSLFLFVPSVSALLFLFPLSVFPNTFLAGCGVFLTQEVRGTPVFFFLFFTLKVAFRFCNCRFVWGVCFVAFKRA